MSRKKLASTIRYLRELQEKMDTGKPDMERSRRMPGLSIEGVTDERGDLIPIQKPVLGVTWEWRSFIVMYPSRMYYKKRPGLWRMIKDFFLWIGPEFWYVWRMKNKEYRGKK